MIEGLHIKAGDIVQLKTGGPSMTVEFIKRSKLEGEDAFLVFAQCSWFTMVGNVNGTPIWNPISSVFAVAALDVVEAGKATSD